MSPEIKKRVRLLGLAIPVLALTVSFLFTLEPLEQKLNWTSAIAAGLGCWIWASALGRGTHLIFSMIGLTLMLRLFLLMWILKSGVPQEIKVNAVLFIIGYHLIEVFGVTAGSWKFLVQPEGAR